MRHELFDQLSIIEVIGDIERLYEAGCVAQPEFIEKLKKNGFYRSVDLVFGQKIFRYFYKAAF